jgi:hypothetical protein
LIGEPEALVYEPDKGYEGLDSFRFGVTDALGFTKTGEIQLYVVKPVKTQDQTLYGSPGLPVPITLTAYDGYAPYEFNIEAEPEQGTLTGTPPYMSYTFDAGFSGLDSFTYSVTDWMGTKATGVIKIRTTQTLTAANARVFTLPGTGIILPLSASGGQPPYTFSVPNALPFGTVSEVESNFIYTPNAGATGTHSVAYTVTDADGYQSNGKITVTVVNLLRLDNQQITTSYETPIQIEIEADGGLPPYEYTLTNPVNGTLSGELPDLTYTPDSGFSGIDGFTITVSDMVDQMVIATINITVEAPITIAAGDTAGLIAAIEAANASPGPDTILLSPGTYILTERYPASVGLIWGAHGLPSINGTLSIRGNGATIMRQTDAPAFRILHIEHQAVALIDNLTISQGSVTGSHNGGGIYNSGNLTITNSRILNNMAFSGGGIINTTTGQLTISGSTLANNHATRTSGAIYNQGQLTVSDSVIANNVADVDHGAIGVGDVTATQAIANVTNSCIAGNSHISVSNGGTNRSVNFSNNWWGAGQGPSQFGNPLPYVGDSVNKTNPVTTDNPLTTAILGCPQATNQIVYTAYGQPVAIMLSASQGTAPYSFSLIANPEHGSVSGTLPNLVYTPEAGFSGEDRVIFRATDSSGLTAAGVVTIYVAPELQEGNLLFGTLVNAPVNITLSGQGGRPPYTFSNITSPAHGTLTGTPPDLTYTPETDYAGSVSFTFVVTDANGSTANGIATVVIGTLEAVDQTLNTPFNTNLTFTFSATGGEMPYTFSIDTPPANGYIIGTTPDLTYSPEAAFSGTDTLTFTVTDAIGSTSSGTISIVVGSPPSATIVVDSTAQEVPFVTNGNCTLGEAIQAANTNTAVDGCSAGADSDIIEVPAGTYTGSGDILTDA